MKKLLLILSLLFILFSCKNNRLDVDVSSVDIDLTVHRMEKEMFEADRYKLAQLNQEWKKKYGLLYESFLYDMTNMGLVDDSLTPVRLEMFLNHKDMNECYQQIDSVFNDFSPYEKDFELAFKHYTYYFPERAIPSITTFFSSFQAKAFITKDNLAVGLGLYLGENNKITQMLPPEFYPAYLKSKMDKKFLVSDAIKHWVYYNFSEPKEYANFSIYTIKEDFLSTIIHHGAMIYTVEALMPQKSPELKFNYTPEKLNWCLTNEKFVYQYFVENSLIYTKNYKDISKHIQDGPFTTGLSDESPAMVGIFMGYRMVKQYMDKHPELTIKDLVNKKVSPREFLSGYKI